MPLKINLISILLCFYVNIHAQDVVKVENQLNAVSRWDFDNAKTLTQQLVRPLSDTADRALIIFKWVSSHIQYDWNLYYNPGQLTLIYAAADNLANYVVKKKKAVCAGYAELLKTMMNEAGIECVEIDGYAKGFGYNAGDSATKINHRWNAIKLNGQWKLIDVTWANETARSTKEKMFFFCTPPEQFIVSHFPGKGEWQLLKDTVSKARFEGLPLIWPAFFYNCSFSTYPTSFYPEIKQDSFVIKLPISCIHSFWTFRLTDKNKSDGIYIYPNRFKTDTTGATIVYKFSLPVYEKKTLNAILMIGDNEHYEGSYAVSFVIDPVQLRRNMQGR